MENNTNTIEAVFDTSTLHTIFTIFEFAELISIRQHNARREEDRTASLPARLKYKPGKNTAQLLGDRENDLPDFDEVERIKGVFGAALQKAVDNNLDASTVFITADDADKAYAILREVIVLTTLKDPDAPKTDGVYTSALVTHKTMMTNAMCSALLDNLERAFGFAKPDKPHEIKIDEIYRGICPRNVLRNDTNVATIATTAGITVHQG